MNSLFHELRRRNVFRVAGIYAVTGWLLMQLAVVLEQTLVLPDWFDTVITLLVLIGFPLTMVGAWAFEMTPDGLKPTRAVSPQESVSRQTGKRLDAILLTAVVILVFVIVADRVIPGYGSASLGSGGGALAIEEASIAVLPFADMSADSDQAYFADGISEELLNVFAQVPGLAVAGRTSSFAFKGKDQDLRKIGELLAVQHILEGSVRKSGNRVRVTAQLVRADNGYHVWSETYDRELDDIFAVQDEIATAILAELTPQLMGEAPPVAAVRTDISAYDLYLLAQQKATVATMEGYQQAANALDQALSIDPDYVPALAWRGYNELMLSDGYGAAGNLPIEIALENAAVWIDKALAIDPASPDALFAKAGLLSFAQEQGNNEQAERYYKLALREKPNFTGARNDYAFLLMNENRRAEAIEQLEMALAHDPAMNDANTNLIAAYVDLGEMEKAEAVLQRWLAIAPDNPNPIMFQAGLAERSGQMARGVELRREALALAPDDPRMTREMSFSLLNVGEYDMALRSEHPDQNLRALVAQGRKEEAQALARREMEARPDHIDATVSYLAVLYYTHEWDGLVAFYNETWGSVAALQADIPNPPYQFLMQALLEAGHPDGPAMRDARRARLDAFRQDGVDTPGILAGEAQFHAVNGDPETALDYLERSYEAGNKSMGLLQDPAYLPLQRTERFEALRSNIDGYINAEREKLGLDPIDMPVPYTEPGL